MKISTDKEAQDVVGSQAYIFSDSSLTPTIITHIKLNKTFSGVGEPQVSTIIVTAIGEFPENEIFINRDELIAYIDNVIGDTQ